MRATHWRPAAAILAALLLSSIGCNEGVSTARNMMDRIEALVDLLKSIQDADSARAAIPQIQPTYAGFLSSLKAMAEYERKHGEVRGRKNEIDKLKSDLARLQGEIKAQADRVDGMRGLPQEFWSVFRLESTKFARGLFQTGAAAGAMDPTAVATLDQLIAMYEQLGAQRVLEISLTHVSSGDKDGAVARIRQLAGADSQIIEMQDQENFDGWFVVVGPVDDMSKFLASANLGSVTDQDLARGNVTIALTQRGFDAAGGFSGDLGGGPSSATFGGGPAPDAPADSSLADSGAPSTAPDAGGYGDGSINLGGGYVPPDAGVAATPPDLPAGLDQAAIEDAAARGPDAIGELLQSLSGGGAPQADATIPGAPNPADPDYHAQLAELLHNPQSPLHEMAVLALLDMTPQDVADKATRERIAKGYRFVAFESGAHQDEAVRGLVVWGGRHAAPLLVDLLTEAQPAAGPGGMDLGDGGFGRPAGGFHAGAPGMGGGVEEAIYAALGELKTRDGADAVAVRLGTSAARHGDAIGVSLRAMGSVGEAALLDTLPFEDTDANLIAILVLGDVGTKKSLSILRVASHSDNQEIADAAEEAIRKIQGRIRAARQRG